MRNKIALLLAVLMLASALLCGCGEEKTLEPWTMPAVDAKPTVEPTPIPAYQSCNPWAGGSYTGCAGSCA